MPSSLELFAEIKRWKLARVNVIVEGTSDVAYFDRASELHYDAFGVPLIDDDFRFLVAGERDKGGADSVAQMLVTMTQLASEDLLPDGQRRARFVGLFDNDPAGRRAFDWATASDGRIAAHRDAFKLLPDMPVAGDGGMPRVTGRILKTECKFVSHDHRFEVEDLLSSNFFARLEAEKPGSVRSRHLCGPHVHYRFSSSGKLDCRKLAMSQGTKDDFNSFFKIVRALRSYVNVPHAGIQVQ